ncbi:hypothetical protein QQ045_022297 [Rhodiola kirilowii]
MDSRLCLVDQVEAAYDMLLMQSLTQRRAGNVSSGIRYADVKPVKPAGTSTMPQWLQTSMKSAPLSLDSPSTGDLGIQAGVYGALIVLTSANGTASSVGAYSGADVPGLVLATSFGASLYFMTKKNVKLGKELASTNFFSKLIDTSFKIVAAFHFCVFGSMATVSQESQYETCVYFGLARFVSEDTGATHISTKVKGLHVTFLILKLMSSGKIFSELYLDSLLFLSVLRFL